SDQLRYYAHDGSSQWYKSTTQLFRDPSAWYHIVIAVDMTESANADKVKMYVNGDKVDDFDQDDTFTTNYQTETNNTIKHFVGSAEGSYPFDGHLAEMYLIDGTALTPSSFGELDSTTNQWIPLDSDDVKDAVTFGTNGFYQKYSATELAASFEDSSREGGADFPLSCDYLIVAGGGGGGGSLNAHSGGGGGGGYRAFADQSLSKGDYTVSVGAGGAGGVGNNSGAAGLDSTFNSITSTGGGGGGHGTAGGGSGGSGGGGGAGDPPGAGGSGTVGQGYAGGSGLLSGSGGGGGASEVGENAPTSNDGGNGGDGNTSSISGSSVTYAGGGGGGSYGAVGVGGAGGGGSGGKYYQPPDATSGT
ncbi:MAG TPA: LamG-like jellyroll fold domain-containing protein, partial [Myxococcota bacterium]|nr:LamG-like jellyroll fold domain-containing protein [Myxococcota bacterium]